MRRLTALVLALGGLVLAGGAVQPAMADQVGPVGPVESVETTSPGGPLELPVEGHAAQGSEGAHEAGGSHDESGSPGLLHLGVEVLQILFAAAAVGSVVLAGRVYGGEVGRALLVSGIGVTLFAIQRLWHNFHELGLVARPTTLGQQTLFILAAGTLAVGYLSLYQTMDKRMG